MVFPEGLGILCLTSLVENPSGFSRTSTVTIAPFLSPHKTTFPYKLKKHVSSKSFRTYRFSHANMNTERKCCGTRR